jgi:hypothetical protein
LNPQAAALAFAQCMRAHGVNVGDPTVSGGGSGGGQVHVEIGTGGLAKGSPQMQAAMTACQKYLPQIGGNGSGTPDPAHQAQALQFAQCMRSHGVADFPDPSSSGGIAINGNAHPDLNPNNPVFQSAQTACQHYLPGKGTGLKTSGGGQPDSGSGPVTGSSAG